MSLHHKESINLTIRRMKGETRASLDDMPAEALKLDVESTAKILYILFREMWEE